MKNKGKKMLDWSWYVIMIEFNTNFLKQIRVSIHLELESHILFLEIVKWHWIVIDEDTIYNRNYGPLWETVAGEYPVSFVTRASWFQLAYSHQAHPHQLKLLQLGLRT